MPAPHSTPSPNSARVLRRVATLFGVVACWLHPSSSNAQAMWQPNGVPFCLRPSCFGVSPQVVPDLTTGVVVRWQRNSTGSDERIFAKRFTLDGGVAPGWLPQGTLLTGAPDNQYGSDMAPDGSGGAYVVWTDYRTYFPTDTDVYMQHVLADGQIAPGWPVDGLAVDASLGGQGFGRLLADGAGGVFVVWTNGNRAIMATRIGPDGSVQPGWPTAGLVVRFAVNATGAGWPLPAADGQGGLFVAWGDTRNPAGTEVYAHHVSRDGVPDPAWPENGKLVATGASNGIRGVAPDGAGGAYVSWIKTYVPGSLDDDVFATRLLANGSVAPGWPSNGLAVAVQPGWQNLDWGTAADSTGGLLLAWSDGRAYPPRVYAQRLRPDGTIAAGWQPQGNPITTLDGYDDHVFLAPDGRGGAFVLYQDAFGGRAYVQRMLASGAIAPGWPSVGLPVVDPTIAGTSQTESHLAPDGEGGAIVVWNDTRDGRGNQLYAQRYSGDDITAATVSLVSFEALPDRVSLAWVRGGAALAEATVERRDGGGAWTALASARFDGTGRLEYEDRAVTPGARYTYRLRWTENGVEQTGAESTVEVPVAIALALEGLRPNPAMGDLNVAFSLPRAGDTTLEVLDIGGRIVARRDLDGLAAGRHVVRMNEGARLNPGAYWLRLTHDGERLLAKGVVLR